jgi:hypothetical protein
LEPKTLGYESKTSAAPRVISTDWRAAGFRVGRLTLVFFGIAVLPSFVCWFLMPLLLLVLFAGSAFATIATRGRSIPGLIGVCVSLYVLVMTIVGMIHGV